MKKVIDRFDGYGGSPADSMDDMFAPTEQVIWRGKPLKPAFILNSCLPLLPIGLIWLIFDGFFIDTIISAGFFDTFGGTLSVFFVLFFAVHLFPVRLCIGMGLSAGRRCGNTEYALTNTRIVICTGVIGVNFKSVYYKEISNVQLRVGVIDKLFKVGDITVKSRTSADSLLDLTDVYEVFKRVQKIVADIQTDIEYPNALRPDTNPGYGTRYNGRLKNVFTSDRFSRRAVP
ncbi:MAG: PH domain-containing protein [Clostridiales bacterium]|jgi:hypothetical protein|nr:PH domain-containing protein [Clostridiales bacterium]